MSHDTVRRMCGNTFTAIPSFALRATSNKRRRLHVRVNNHSWMHGMGFCSSPALAASSANFIIAQH
jgi:hypothetical protein